MKILHTSDWHIGKRLYSKDLDRDHELFFDWMIDYINKEKVELLLISGDIFDVAYPSNNALQQYYKVLKNLIASSCRDVVIIAGNHDSVSTINAPQQILEFLNIHVVGGFTSNYEDELIQIKSVSGQTKLIVCAVPFLRDKDVRSSISGETYDQRLLSIRNGIGNHFREISELIKPFKDEKIPVFAMAHLLASGAEFSDSEREIYIGNLGSVGADIFSNWFDYVALGHIHKPQKVANLEHIRYSGSPIALSFSENLDNKIMVLVEVEIDSPIIIQCIDIPKFRRLLKIENTFSLAKQKLVELDTLENSSTWIDLLIQEKIFKPGLISEIENFITELKFIEVINFKIVFSDKAKHNPIQQISKNGLREIKVSDVFDSLLENLEPNLTVDLKESFMELFDVVSQIEK